MTFKRWITAALFAGGVVFVGRASSGCLNKPAADQRLAQQFDELCEIARDHVDSPEPGVRALGRYLGKRTGDLLGNLGDTFATIERISDDEAHDERARLARERIQKPLRACAADWARFAEAIEADPEASALVDKAMVRLNRTIEIVLGSASWKLRDLPGQLEHVLEPRAERLRE